MEDLWKINNSIQYNTFTLSPSAMSTIFFPVAGFTVGKVFPETASTNSLLMKSWKIKYMRNS
jgi:hypothetical protein